MAKKKMNNPKYWAMVALEGKDSIDKMAEKYAITDEHREQMLQAAAGYVKSIKEIIK
jgi:hypothetical protein